MTGLITLTFSGFPGGFCYPGDPSQLFADGLNATVVNYNTNVGSFLYNVGPNEPSVDNRVYPWYRTESTDYFDGWYYWSTTHSGWIQPHPVLPSSNVRQLWVGSINDLLTYDGGTNVVVTDTAGPFWEVDTDFDAKIPMGPGTTTGGTAITVGANAGADKVALDADNVPEHYHFINIEGASTIATPSSETDGYIGIFSGADLKWGGTSPPASGLGKTNDNIQPSGAQTDVTIVPPVRGCYVIKRTARIYRFI